MWVRGLKQNFQTLAQEMQVVAPRVGAWIETSSVSPFYVDLTVAPRVGAWIETITDQPGANEHFSRTPCGCVD